MIIEIAWKNVWRNKARSLIVITAMAVGVFAGVFALAAMNSSVVQRIDAAVNEELSHIQINNKEFRSSGEIQDFLPDFELLRKTIDTIPGVTAVTGRIIVRGMASTATKSRGIEITGIDIKNESEIFTLRNRIVEGTGGYFDSETRFNKALIGEKLAKELNIIRYILSEDAIAKLAAGGVSPEVCSKLEKLKEVRFTTEKKFSKELSALLTPEENKKYGLRIKETAWSYREGSKVILSFLDIDNHQTNAAFRITGIFRTNNDMFEALSVFVPEGELRELAGMAPGIFHRAVVKLESDEMTEESTSEIRKALPGFEVLNWKEIQPELAMLADMMQQIYAVFMGIILAALAFGIVNTMLMSVLERTREFGMLAAVGMNHRKTFVMVMLESVFLSLTGGIAGMGLGAVTIAATARTGINLVKYSEGMEAFGYSAHLFPTIDAQFFFITAVLIILTGILSSVYPARKALKLNPVEALRSE